ncbi:MAG TPA: NIPSNAP family protein [Povalibacter sp.]|nr:NIPSNAP family protein [Povalibacter sp.]
MRYAARLPWILLTCLLLSGVRAEERAPIHQLRIYEIFDGNKQAFHDRFRDHAARIMAKYQFSIVAMWESKFDGRTEFVYLLQWPDEATMKARWAEFMADEEWKAIKKQTGAKYGPLVGDIEDRTLHLTDYSPRRDLIR